MNEPGNWFDQSRQCHPERSEGSGCPAHEIMSAAKDDKCLPILLIEIHQLEG
jgi:hypothetical protein